MLIVKGDILSFVRCWSFFIFFIVYFVREKKVGEENFFGSFLKFDNFFMILRSKFVKVFFFYVKLIIFEKGFCIL